VDDVRPSRIDGRTWSDVELDRVVYRRNFNRGQLLALDQLPRAAATKLDGLVAFDQNEVFDGSIGCGVPTCAIWSIRLYFMALR
jgi:hypothetical protein